MSRVLILQICIGKGNLDWENSGANESKFLNEVTMQSTREYALKFGYSYKCVDTLSTELTKLPENKMSSKMNLTFEKYMHLNLVENYDYVVIIDADMLVSSRCPALPLGQGFSGAPNWQWRINKYHPDWVGRCILVNAGFQMFDKECATRFFKYFKQELSDTNSVLYTDYYHDEVFLAHFLRINTDIVYNNLGQQWNDTEISNDNSLPFNEAHMYHLAGPYKETKYNRIISCLKKIVVDTNAIKDIKIESNQWTRTRVKKI
jgi:hypothetical protein